MPDREADLQRAVRPDVHAAQLGDAAGWTDASQYSTIQLADVLGEGRDQLIGRGPGGIEIWEFDTTVGQWRPAVDANGDPMILTEFADPPPLTAANPDPPDTDWALPQYYTTIQTGDLLGTGRPQIIGRSAHGVIVFSYTPGTSGAAGTWTQAPATGSFGDATDAPPGWYPTIGTADLVGGPADELYGIGGDFNLRVVSWTGDGWLLLPAIGTTFPPGVAGNTLQPSPVIDGHQELWWETAQGVQGTRIDGTTGDWVGTEIPAPGSYADPDWTQLPASATLRFADLQGPSTPVIVGRSTGGLTEIAHTSGDWERLPDLDALSDSEGFDAEQYWRTITYADVDGDGQAELLVRGPEGVDIWKLEADGWQPLSASIGRGRSVGRRSVVLRHVPRRRRRRGRSRRTDRTWPVRDPDLVLQPPRAARLRPVPADRVVPLLEPHERTAGGLRPAQRHGQLEGCAEGQPDLDTGRVDGPIDG